MRCHHCLDYVIGAKLHSQEHVNGVSSWRASDARENGSVVKDAVTLYSWRCCLAGCILQRRDGKTYLYMS